MTTKYITNGHDLTGLGGHRLRVQRGEKGFELEERLHVEGDKDTDGSSRFAMDVDTGYTEIQQLVDGIWQPGDFETGPRSFWVGRNIGLAAAGHHLMTEDAEGRFHFLVHTDYDGHLSTSDAKTVVAYYYLTRVIAHDDDSATWSGTAFSWVSPADYDALIHKGYFKTGPIAASAPVRIRCWEGASTSGTLIFDQYFPADSFPANTEIALEETGDTEVSYGNNYLTELSSTIPFSLRTNASGTLPWTAADASMTRHDNLLQTAEWASGSDYMYGEWFIDHDTRKIYTCNVSGTQTGTFEDNSDKWDLLANMGTVSGTIVTHEATYNHDFTEGSVPFGTAGGTLGEDNTNLFWDNNNSRLGIGTPTPSTLLEVNGDAKVLGKASAYRLSVNSDPSTTQLQIYETGDGDPVYIDGLQGSSIYITSSNGNQFMAKFNAAGSVELYRSNSKKFETTDTGVDITGTLVADGIQVNGPSYLNGTTSIIGDLTVSGTTFTTQHETVEITDNLLIINDGEVGAGVTVSGNIAGIEVDRGSLTNYRFVFDEIADNFRIGEIGSLQAVATREDAPTTSGILFWNNSEYRFDTHSGLIYTNSKLKLTSGTGINEFSTDGTLVDNSDDAVPTEKAVKTYVDAQTHTESDITDLDKYTQTEVDTISGTLQDQLDNTTFGNQTIASGSNTVFVSFDTNQPDTNYYICTEMRNTTDPDPSMYAKIISETTVSGFTALFGGSMISNNYSIDWHIIR